MNFFYHSKQGDINQLNSSRRVSIVLKNCVLLNFYASFVGVAGTSHETEGPQRGVSPRLRLPVTLYSNLNVPAKAAFLPKSAKITWNLIVFHIFHNVNRFPRILRGSKC